MATIRIDLTEKLGEGQYVDIFDPKDLPWAEQKKLQSTMKDNSIESQGEFAEYLAIILTTNGNVFDWKGNAMVFPMTKESIGNIPAIVIEEIVKKYVEVRSKGADIPKK